jgi:N-acetyl sugar amidotransferase
MIKEDVTKEESSTLQCKHCIIDTRVPGTTFDSNGICNFCHLHDRMEKEFPMGEQGSLKIKQITDHIKLSGKKKKYDCVLGVSGGRDSMYTLYYVKKILGLNPIAVHFNDGFGNPVAGENMIKATKKLGVELRTITSDWRESKDLKIAFLKASTPDLEEGTDVGIATSLYAIAAKENVKYILIGQSFRTEGIAPLSWNYLDGKYLKSVHKKFGSIPLRKWKPTDPGFNLDLKEIFYYVVIKRIRTVPILYYLNYIRKDVDQLLIDELDWVNPGAHYFDDLYQALMTYVHRTKFNINRRIYNYSALVRSGQMTREEALVKSKEIYAIEDPKIIDLCIKRLGLTQEEFQSLLRSEIKTFRDYPNNYSLIKKSRLIIKILSKLDFLPASTYDKYFNCGK